MEGMKNAKPHIFSSASYVACLLLGNYSCATTEKQHGMLQIKAGSSSGPEPYIVKPVSVNRTSNNIKKMEEECTLDCVSDFCKLDRFFYSNGRLELSGFGPYIQYFGQVTKHQKPLLNSESHCGNYSSNSFSNYILWPTPQQLEIAPTFSLGLVPFTFKPKLVFFQLYRIRPNCSEVLANTSKKVKPATKTVTGYLTRQTLQLLDTFNQVFSDQRMSSVPSFGKCNHIIW